MLLLQRLVIDLAEIAKPATSSKPSLQETCTLYSSPIYPAQLIKDRRAQGVDCFVRDAVVLGVEGRRRAAANGLRRDVLFSTRSTAAPTDSDVAN